VAPVYAYKCRKCGVEIEAPRLLAENSRHMVEKKVCGTLRRVWGGTNFNRVPGGGRD
jgi:ribosomal protein L40E